MKVLEEIRHKKCFYNSLQVVVQRRTLLQHAFKRVHSLLRRLLAERCHHSTLILVAVAQKVMLVMHMLLEIVFLQCLLLASCICALDAW